jgi:hypothetical protein
MNPHITPDGSLDIAAHLQELRENHTRTIQSARLNDATPSEIYLLNAIGDYLDALEPNDPKLLSRLERIAQEYEALANRRQFNAQENHSPENQDS